MKKLTSLNQLLSGEQSKSSYLDDMEIDLKKRKRKGIYARTSFDFIQLIQNWEKIVGKMMAQNTIPLKIQNRTLVIVAKHAIFANELNLMSPQLIKGVTDLFPALDGKINKVKFYHSDYSSEYFNKIHEKKKAPVQKQELHPFSPEFKKKKKDALKTLETIEDEEIKESLLKYLLSK